jgi:hypothetical protein
MNTWRLLIITGAVTIVLVLIIGIERNRNCRYSGGIHCETAARIDIGKFGVRVEPSR